MAFQVRQGPRRGLSAGKAAAQSKVSYTVLKDIGNATKIAGRRRAKGDVFMATPRHMTFLVLEGIVGLTSPAAPAAATTKPSATAAPAPAAPAASSSASTKTSP